MTERMTALLRRASEGDREAESVLVSENSGLIHTIARRYFGRGAEPDDLYQLACVGFIKAVRGFDPARGNAAGSSRVAGRCSQHFSERVRRAERFVKRKWCIPERKPFRYAYS